MYYKSKHTGRIFMDNTIHILNDIYGEDYVKEKILNEDLEEIEAPHIVDCIKYGGIVVGGIRYRELHPGVTPKEAIKAVKQIKTVMFRLNSAPKKKPESNKE